jgi:acetyl esterase
MPADDDVIVHPDIAYGQHPRQQIDIYSPAEAGSSSAPVLFVHGGAFMDGNRNRTEKIRSNMLKYFSLRGIIGINIGYRLGDDTKYPGATEDIASVVRWMHEHASELGVSPSLIFLMGHSADAAHAGSCAYDRRFQPAEGSGLAGFIVVSGRMRAENRPENPNAEKVIACYDTDDAQRLNDVSPVSHVTTNSVPTFVAWGEYENLLIDVPCAELVYRLAVAKNRSPPVVWLRGHNHTSTIAHVNTAENILSGAMLDFIAKPR